MQNAPVQRAAEAPPVQLRNARRWLLWSLESRTRKDGSVAPVKVPRYVTGKKRSGDISNDQDRLSSYEEALAALRIWGFAGLAIALGDGWQGIDFDHIDQRPQLLELANSLPLTYLEYSPSGAGLHAIGYGARFDALGSNPSGIEAYSEGRFFTFTGHVARPGVQVLADLAPFVTGVLKPRHEAARRTAVQSPKPATAATGDRVIDELTDALRHLDADDRGTWVEVGQCLHTLGDVGYRLWADWSDTDRYPGGEDLERWDGFKGQRTSYASVFTKAEACGWRNPRRIDPASIFAGSVFDAPLPPVAPLAPPTANAPAAPPARLDGQSYRAPDGQQRPATLENVVKALDGGVRLAFDTFQEAIVIGQGSDWRPITDIDYGHLRMTLGAGGFKPVPAEIMRTSVDIVAQSHKMDSAKEWAEGLKWDGCPRIDRMMSTYYGCQDSAYARSVGAYLMTALAGRCLVPGIKADMAVIMVGLQGVRKTSAIEALAPHPDSFGEINLKKDDDGLARKLRGKLVLEWAEMRGLATRDLESLKAWFSRRREEWTPKWKEMNTTYWRRCIVIGTANGSDLLDDPSGERRWLPIKTGRTDVAAIERDRNQLWAEGVDRFKAGGVEWELAESLARNEHEAFKIYDEWSDPVIRWLNALPIPKLGEIPSFLPNGVADLELQEVASGALHIQNCDFGKRERDRLGKIMRNFGYESISVRESDHVVKRWRKVTPETRQI